jgi:SAM-dependent methyltransferase
MQEFWDERARENAMFFIDSRLDYESTNVEQFWAGAGDDLDLVLDAAGGSIAPTDKIVEIGCGVGRMTRAMADRAAHVTALDISAEMIDQAKRHNEGLENVTWVHGDGTSLAGIADASADGAFSHVVFQHIPDPAVTLGYVREIGRVLAPGGWAVFQVSNEPEIHKARTNLDSIRLRTRAALGRAPKGQAHPAWRGSAVELDDLRAAVADGGMDIQEMSGEGTQYCFVRTLKRSTN